MKRYFITIIFVFFIGCASRVNRAPIVNITKLPQYLTTNSNVKPLTDEDSPEETSQIKTPSSTKISSLDQDNVVTTTNTQPSSAPLPTPIVDTPKMIDVTPTIDSKNGWTMPTKGNGSDFNLSDKGIDIYGNIGQKVFAAKDGTVVYSGNGLKGYGNLIIIKHKDGYLTAYSKNQSLLVKEGQAVTLGQQIATMGSDESSKGILHFELRLHGKPLNPYKIISNN